MKLDYNEEEQALRARADELEKEAVALRQQADEKRSARDDRPLKERMTFAAQFRCICGHGMAYDPEGKVRSDTDSPFVMAAQWECSAILLGIADPALRHTAPHPFAFYEVKSENQPSAHGATTREPGPATAEAKQA